MYLRRLSISQFRNYEHADLTPSAGLTVIVGRNGQGKTNLVEAAGYLSTLASFRGATADVLIRDGADQARVRGAVDVEGRSVDIETAIARHGPNRVSVNGQRLGRSRDLLGVMRVTVFAPDDLDLIKAGPAARRHYLDDLVVGLRPSMDATRVDLDRVLRQRSTLLRSTGGRPDADALATLDVWDERLVELATALGAARQMLVSELEPWFRQAYEQLAGGALGISLHYESAWMEGGLGAALVRTRSEDIRRGTTTVGAHRDELLVSLHSAVARTHASQGEQRCLALALRLAGHQLLHHRHGSPPILLLDDVFSELDPVRTEALLTSLPEGQTLLTTAEAIPPQASPDLIVTVEDGKLS